MGSKEERFRESVNTLFNCADQVGLSAWESDFITDMHDRKSLDGISDKQAAKIEDLEEKYL